VSLPISFKAIGLSNLVKKLESITPKQNKELSIALGESTVLVHGEARKSIQAHLSSGIKYGNHTASKAGYPPNSDTGMLVKHIDWNIDYEKMVSQVGTNLKDGAWREFGTRYIEERPWLRPAFLKMLPRIKKIMTKSVKEALK
jgi:hypothetical protein